MINSKTIDTKLTDAFDKNKVFSILISIGIAHLMNDLLQGILPAMYPILRQNYKLSFFQIGMITFSFQFTASILQPIVGYYSDKYPKPFSQVYGLFFSSLGIVLLSFATSFELILISSILIGMGSAVFHPEAGRISNLASGGRFGIAQSIFQFGGNIGTALAPLIVALFIVPNSQHYLLWLLIVSVIGFGFVTKVSYWYRDYLILNKYNNKKKENNYLLSRKNVKLAIFTLLLIVLIKFIYSASLSTYYSFYLIDKFGLTIKQAQIHMFIYLIAHMFGTLIGGPIGDKLGRIHLIWFSIFGAVPFTVLLPYANLFYTDILIIIIGLIMSSAFPAIIVYALELAPHKLGMISGLFYGFAFGIAAISAALLGVLIDVTSIGLVYKICSFIPILGVVCYFLPNLNTIKK